MNSLAEEQQSDINKHKALKCRIKAREIEQHNYIPVSWSLSTSSKHVTMLMCTHCFKKISMHDSNTFAED